MKITKAKLKQIIKEELEEVVSVYGHPRMQEFPRPDFGGIEKKAMKALKKKQKSHRKTQVELPAGDKYEQMLQIIKARLGATVNDEQAEKLAKELSDTLTGEEK